ncbi:MAG: hypothetical protein WD645_06520 [Dehalococcoidia bacterium]
MPGFNIGHPVSDVAFLYLRYSISKTSKIVLLAGVQSASVRTMTLGNVGKASQAEFAGKRKLLLVPHVVATRDDAALHALVSAYWEEAIGQVRKLEASFGPVRHVFHEGSVGQGSDAAEALERGNPVGFPFIQQTLERGAVLEPTEDPEALGETLDLHRCLAVVQSSHAVLHKLVDWFEESRQRRYSGIAERIDRAMASNDAALLVISPDHEVQFAKDIEVIYVVPPALDKINRWLRDHQPVEASQETSIGEHSG